MSRTILRPALAASLIFTMVIATGGQVFAQEPSQSRVRGTFSDYVWVETGSGAGAWHVTGEWNAQLNRASSKGEFIASLLGVRSDLWVIQTDAERTNPALRMPHTHHVGLLNAEVTHIPNGVRLTGTAVITSNGSIAPFSGAPVQVDITGGNLIGLSNIKLTFFGAAAVEHFGPQPYDGIVVFER